MCLWSESHDCFGKFRSDPELIVFRSHAFFFVGKLDALLVAVVTPQVCSTHLGEELTHLPYREKERLVHAWYVLRICKTERALALEAHVIAPCVKCIFITIFPPNPPMRSLFDPGLIIRLPVLKQKLVPVIRPQSCARRVCADNSIGTEGAKAIAKGLWENPVLVDLCMSGECVGMTMGGTHADPCKVTRAHRIG